MEGYDYDEDDVLINSKYYIIKFKLIYYFIKIYKNRKQLPNKKIIIQNKEKI